MERKEANMVDSNQPHDADTSDIAFGRLPRASSVTAWELARYDAGELSTAQRTSIEDALKADPALKAELDEMRAEKAAFAAQMPFARFEADHAARRSRGLFARLTESIQGLFGGGLLPAAGALGACALLLVVVAKTQDAPATTRTKGGDAEIAYFIKEGDNARLGRDGETLFAGDRIQFAVVDDAKAQSMVIVGIDGTGAVTVYAKDDLNREKGSAGSIREPRVLARSIILDEAVGPERFFVLYDDEPAEVLVARAKKSAEVLVKSGGDLSRHARLPLHVRSQSSVHIIKQLKSSE